MDKRPVAGKRIVVTRAPDQAQELVRALESLGAEVLIFPTVRFEVPENWHDLDAALRGIASFDWILFSSQNAVRFFCRRARELGLIPAQVQSPRPLIAAIGPATSQAAEVEGLRVDYVAKKNSGEDLARELWGSLSGRSVLLPRSDRADDRLPEALQEAGAKVNSVVAYGTLDAEAADPGLAALILRGDADAVIFASPSAFHNFSKMLGGADLLRLSARTQFAAIGPTTARALRDAGIHVEIEATEASSAGLADALVKYFQRSSVAGRSS
jgi:uroporphyrinogen III methyltransferase / synthase